MTSYAYSVAIILSNLDVPYSSPNDKTCLCHNCQRQQINNTHTDKMATAFTCLSQ